MKAAVYYGRGDVRIEDQPAPTHAGTGEVVLQVLKHDAEVACCW